MRRHFVSILDELERMRETKHFCESMWLCKTQTHQQIGAASAIQLPLSLPKK